jgi:hypothetical protein
MIPGRAQSSWLVGSGESKLANIENLWLFALDWRKGWDSNPRYPCGHAGFQDRCLKPLGHPSSECHDLAKRAGLRKGETRHGPKHRLVDQVSASAAARAGFGRFEWIGPSLAGATDFIVWMQPTAMEGEFNRMYTKAVFSRGALRTSAQHRKPGMSGEAQP